MVLFCPPTGTFLNTRWVRTLFPLPSGLWAQHLGFLTHWGSLPIPVMLCQILWRYLCSTLSLSHHATHWCWGTLWQETNPARSCPTTSPCGTPWRCSSSTSCGPNMSVLSLATRPAFSEARLSFLPARQKILGSQSLMTGVLLCLSNQFTQKMSTMKGLILQTQEYSTHLLRLTFNTW